MAHAHAADDLQFRRLAQEQAALRQVATLVAEGAPPERLLAVVAEQVARVLDVPLVSIVRYEGDGTATEYASYSERGELFRVGTRWSLQGTNVVAGVRESGRPARIDDYRRLSGMIAEACRRLGIQSTIGIPIAVEGGLWGAMVVSSTERDSLPPDTEARLVDFTDLVSTAIANADARTEVERLAEEQAALRRVATLVAKAVAPSDLFHAVAREVGTLLGADFAGMLRFDDDGTAATLATWAAVGAHPRVPERWPTEPGDPTTMIGQASRPARVDDWSKVPGALAAFIRDELGATSSVGCPIVVDGRLWGGLAVHSKRAPLPPETAPRLLNFTELVATAIANTNAGAEVRRLAQEQAALRRVATLVAREAPEAEVFTAIAEEIGQLLGAEEIRMLRYEDDSAVVVGSWGDAAGALPLGSRQPLGGDNATTRVRRTGRPTRIDDYRGASGPIAESARVGGIRNALATPIRVEGRLWGVIVMASTTDNPLPPGVESRLGQFTELMATAIANTESRARADRLADEQAALRRVATLVANNASPEEILRSVPVEVAALLGVDATAMLRYEDDGTATVVADGGARPGRGIHAGLRAPVEGENVTALVLRTGGPARIDYYAMAHGPLARIAREQGIASAVGCPITVHGRLWGVMVAGSRRPGPLPPDTEVRIGHFTELVATALANAEARAEVRRLAHEQAALRRVATLVAKEASLEQVFAKVAEQVATVFGDVECVLFRDDGDGTATAVAAWSARGSVGVPVGTPGPMDEESVIALVLREGRPCRIADYSAVTGTSGRHAKEMGIRSAVGCPIVVGGRLWGAMAVGRREAEPFPPETETRIARFSDLVATAIANTEASAEVERLADEQGALRRVATLVAQGAAPTAVFDAVAVEMQRLLDPDDVALSRYERGAAVTILAHRGAGAERLPPGTRVSHEGESVTSIVRRTGRPARIEQYEGMTGEIAEIARDLGARSVVGAPIVVDRGLWGVIVASWSRDESPAADTEERMAHFAELLDTAIANADSRDQLAASRARLLTAADEARRRVVRDLHDGAQQRLVQTILTLRLAQRAFGDDGEAEALIRQALEQAEQGNAELRELAHGILPPVLTRGGLQAAVNSLVTRLDVLVDVDVPAERFAEEIEASAYFIIAEALTNVVKHSQASHAEVMVSVDDRTLHIDVRDDGIGGADPDGHGLVGIGDRVTALGGGLEVESPVSGGTVVTATLPLDAAS
ncbi:MAG TPA: GAF domain-containing protein [Thermoleophilaceae bacterium]|nr:GAF domain-containing protein [Thermoleophilaceae bacterium]